ncbi:MAG: hypothetical protein AAF939_11025 [Planctomycetota bacterium]
MKTIASTILVATITILSIYFATRQFNQDLPTPADRDSVGTYSREAVLKRKQAELERIRKSRLHPTMTFSIEDELDSEFF